MVVLALALTGILPGCADDEPTAGRGGPCPDPPPSVAPPTLPDGIPWPEGAVVTEFREDSSLLTVVGFTEESLDEAVDRFRSAFERRSLLTLGPAEGDGDRTSLSIGGPSTQGTLTLSPGCDRTDVRLELRPLVGG